MNSGGKEGLFGAGCDSNRTSASSKGACRRVGMTRVVVTLETEVCEILRANPRVE